MSYTSRTNPNTTSAPYQTFADFQSPTMMQQSPVNGAGGQSPSYSYGNPSPYSNDGMGVGLMSTSPPKSHIGIDTFSIEATMFSPDLQNGCGNNGMYLDMSHTQQANGVTYSSQNIKQEPVQYDAQYYSNVPVPPMTGGIDSQKPFRNDNSYVAQAKARYATVTVGGKRYHQHHHEAHKQPSPEDATIMGISQWLQQGTSPHVY